MGSPRLEIQDFFLQPDGQGVQCPASGSCIHCLVPATKAFLIPASISSVVALLPTPTLNQA